jgi:hypothetical protein
MAPHFARASQRPRVRRKASPRPAQGFASHLRARRRRLPSCSPLSSAQATWLYAAWRSGARARPSARAHSERWAQGSRLPSPRCAEAERNVSGFTWRERKVARLCGLNYAQHWCARMAAAGRRRRHFHNAAQRKNPPPDLLEAKQTRGRGGVTNGGGRVSGPAVRSAPKPACRRTGPMSSVLNVSRRRAPSSCWL